MASIKRIERKSGPRFKVIWWDKTGHQQPKTLRSEEQVKRKAILVEADKIQGKSVDTGLKRTYGELAEEWLRGRRNLTPKVRGNYRNRLDRQLLPFWSFVRMEKVDVDSVSQWVEWWENARILRVDDPRSLHRDERESGLGGGHEED